MKFDCSKCLSSCKGACCGVFPMDVEFVLKNLHKSAVPIDPIPFGEHEGKRHIFPATNDGYCLFLNRETRSCNVYEDRPDVCKMYGDESCKELTCPWQDKNGRIRTRQEKRAIFRQQEDSSKELAKLMPSHIQMKQVKGDHEK